METNMPYTLAKLLADVKIAAILARFGPNHMIKFQAAHVKFGIPLDEVIQIALLVVLEKMHDYDHQRKLDRFLWAHLNARLKRITFGALKYAVSINDDTEFGIRIQNFIESIVVENNDRPDWKIEEISQVPDLVKLKEYAESISGKSTREIAIESELSTRRINQKLQEKIALAEKLRRQIIENVAPKK